MRLDDLRQSYDAVVSIGANCQPAYQLERLQLRKFPTPLDWVGTFSLPHLSWLIRKNFTDFMDLHNLQLAGNQPGYQHFFVVDQVNLLLSIHDFPIEKPLEESYPAQKLKFGRQIKRFLNIVENSDSILFVRVLGDYQGILDLHSALSEKVKGKFTILLINYHEENQIIEDDWGLPGVCCIKIPNDPSRWEGIDYWWDEVFKGITLTVN